MVTGSSFICIYGGVLSSPFWKSDLASHTWGPILGRAIGLPLLGPPLLGERLGFPSICVITFNKNHFVPADFCHQFLRHHCFFTIVMGVHHQKETCNGALTAQCVEYYDNGSGADRWSVDTWLVRTGAFFLFKKKG